MNVFVMATVAETAVARRIFGGAARGWSRSELLIYNDRAKERGPLPNSLIGSENLLTWNDPEIAAVEAVGDRVREQEEFFVAKQAA